MAQLQKLTQRFIVILVLVNVIAGCHNFYKATKSNADNNVAKAALVDSLKQQTRYFVLRNGNQSFYMKNVSLNSDKKTMECILDTLSADHQLHLVNGRRGKMRYNKGRDEDKGVINEVHFYILADNTTTFGNYTLQLDRVQKIEIIEKDKAKTTSSYVIGAIGYTLGTVALVAIIAVATKSSCPFVSAYDGDNFSLQGEIYGGAIYPQLARHDYMPLKMSPLADGTLQLKISNELKEHQFTDMAELWVVTHDKGSKVFADEKGNLFSISAPQTPVSAILNERKDVTASLLQAGDNAMLYMDDTAVINATNEVVLQFNKPPTATKAKLLLTLKNSYFLDLLYGELAKGFGKYYSTYIKQQRSKPKAELLKWVQEQRIPLQVSVKTNSGWKNITDITTIGPVATRNMILPIELPQTTEPFTAIKLSSGFMFWEIDYAAIDYSEDIPFAVQKITASTATDETGKNVLPNLLNEDGVYLSQPDIGNVATIVYKNNSLVNDFKEQTYILHTKGYYEHIRDFKNKPNISFLKQFKKPGAFPLYGIQVYKKISNESLKTLAKSN
ncbi:hypothetical protein [Ferruginibacter sp.]|nr:hypothetical protein [Ferruginibacter sp.]